MIPTGSDFGLAEWIKKTFNFGYVKLYTQYSANGSSMITRPAHSLTNSKNYFYLKIWVGRVDQQEDPLGPGQPKHHSDSEALLCFASL